MDIEARLLSRDGTRVASLRLLARSIEASPASDAMSELLALAVREEAALQVGATWVLKDLAQRGRPPTGSLVDPFLGLLDRVQAPDAALHLLQTLPHVEIPVGREDRLRRRILAWTDSRRAFVRAWAYYALGLLAARTPRFRAETEAMLDRAAGSDSAAVRVRVRRAQELLEAAGRAEAKSPASDVGS